MEEALANLFLLSSSDDIESSIYYDTHEVMFKRYMESRGITKYDMFRSEIGINTRVITEDTSLNNLSVEAINVLRGTLPLDETGNADVLHSTAQGILEYYKMNSHLVIVIGGDNFSINDFYNEIGKNCNLERAIFTITRCADIVLPSVKFTTKIKDIMLVDNILTVPSSLKSKFSESLLIKAIAEVLVRTDFISKRPDTLYSTLRSIQENLDRGEIKKVFNPHSKLFSTLRTQHILYLNGASPSLQTLFARIGYTLPNLFMSYDKETECSYYATHDNKSIVIVQWNELDLIGTAVVPLQIAEEIYRSKSRLHFVSGRNILVDYPEFQDQMIATINSMPLFKIFDEKTVVDDNPNILKGV